MTKKIVIAVLLLLLVYIYLVFNPILVESGQLPSDQRTFDTYTKGDRVKVFDAFDFEKGNWKACVIIHERKEISENVPLANYLVTTDVNVLKRLKNLSFEYTEGDMATPLNEIIIYQDNKTVFRSFIVLDRKTEGMQSQQFGWIRSGNNEFSKIVSDFGMSFAPYVSL